MASSNKTALGLNLWSLADVPEMGDFNTDNQLIDGAITAARVQPTAFTIPSSAWVEDTPTENINFSATLVIPNVTELDRVDLAFDLQSSEYGADVGISSTTETAANGVIVYSQDRPTQPLSGAFVVFRGGN